MTRLTAVLFDLDGTLLDTAPDMVDALQQLRADAALEPVDFAAARAHVSNGAAGLLRVGFPHLSDAGREALRDRYLEIYADRLARATRLFPGMAAVLDMIEAAGVPWGVVTNKPAYLTEPLLEQMELLARCACVVSGDTLPRRKPDPAPLLHAAGQVGVSAASAVYVGDAPRDIQAGRAAGMFTVAATYGYVLPDDDPQSWQADHAIASPAELGPVLAVLGLAGGRP
jgi:phosphoglycolate phosphatase